MSNTKSGKNSAYSWVVLIMITLCYTSTFFSRFVWSPVMSEAAGDIGMTMSQAGGLMSAFYFGYLILQIPAGIVADRIRVKYPMFVCMLLVALCTWLMSADLVSSYTSAYIVRFMGGFFSGTIMACASRLLSNYFEAKVRGIAFGILLASPSLGTLLANQIGPRVLEAAGWRTTFQVCAYIILVIAVLAVVLIREPKADPAAAAAAGEKSSLLAGLRNYFTNKQLIILSIAGFLFMAIPTGYSTWANQFMTGAAPAGGGLSSIQGGTIVTCYAVASVVGSMSSGFIGKRLNWNRKHLIIEIYIAMAVFLFLFGMQRSFTGLLITSVLFGLVSCFSSSHITTWAVNIGGSKYAATTTATQNLLLQASNVIFPTVAGSIVDGATVDGVVTSYMGVWYMYCAMLVVAAVVMLFTSKKSAAESMQ